MRIKQVNRFEAVKILERDERYEHMITDSIRYLIEKLEIEYGYDTEQMIANQRYNYIEKAKNECMVVTKSKETVTDKLDKVFLNKWAAIPIFICIMALIYFLTVGLVGNWTIDLVDNLFNKLSLALGGSGVDGEQLGLLVNLVLQTGLLVLFVMA